MPNFDISDCFESFHQNISSIENLKNCKNKYDEVNLMQTRTIVPFDFNKAKYEVGQWVDVKDTIDQWLEAQVIQVRSPNQALIHYNGWGTRWDEWINFESPKIAPFRTYTVQSTSSLFLSPFPSIPCDANVQPQERAIDSYYYLQKCSNYMNELNNIIDNITRIRKTSQNVYSFCENKEKEIKIKEDNRDSNYPNLYNSSDVNKNDMNILLQTSQLIPMLDRCGRLFSDVSTYLSHVILNPNLCNKLLLDNSKIKESKDNKKQEVNDNTISLGNNNSMPIINSDVNNENNINSHSNTNNSYSSSINANENTYNILNSSSELPFIQRLQNNQTQNQSTNHTNVNRYQDSWPKINLQVPAIINTSGMGTDLLSAGSPNIDIYVQTIVTSPQNINQNINTNTHNTSENTIRPEISSNTDNNLRNFNINNLLNRMSNTSDSNRNEINIISNRETNRRNEDNRIGLLNSFYKDEGTQTDYNIYDENKNIKSEVDFNKDFIHSENSYYEECDDENDISNEDGNSGYDIDDV